MKRKVQTDADSLELLLDTVCNLFGGILFISILIVVLINTSGGSKHKESKITQRDIELLNNQHNLNLITLERLQEQRKVQEDLLSKFVSPDLQDKLSDLKKTNNELKTLEDNAESLKKLNIDQLETITKTESEITSFENTLKQLNEEVSETTKELELQIKEKSVKLPRMRTSTQMLFVQCACCYDRFYLRHKWSLGMPTGPNLNDYYVIEQDHKTITVHPKISGGIPISNGSETIDNLRNYLQQFHPSRHVIDITLRPDSFDSFPELRSQLLLLGFKYTVYTCDVDTSISDRGGADPKFQ